MATGTGLGNVVLFEDFNSDSPSASRWIETVASSATQNIQDKHGGWWRQVLAGDDADATLIAWELTWEIDEGFPIIMETRLQTSVAASSSIFVGVTDNNAESGAVVIEDEDGTLNTVATDAYGFLLEGEQDATWQAVGVDSDTDKTQAAMTGTTDAANATTQVVRTEAWPTDSGTVFYYVDGVLGSKRTSWVDTSLVLCPAVSSDDRNTAYNVDIDYVYVTAPRGS